MHFSVKSVRKSMKESSFTTFEVSMVLDSRLSSAAALSSCKNFGQQESPYNEQVSLVRILKIPNETCLFVSPDDRTEWLASKFVL